MRRRLRRSTRKRRWPCVAPYRPSGCRPRCRCAARPRRSVLCAAALGCAGAWAVRAIRGEPHLLPWNAPLGPRRSLAFTRLRLADARRVRKAHGGTVNDVVLTALAGGLRRYLQARGLRHRPETVTALVPVSLRAPSVAPLPGNCLSAVRVPLALEPNSELDRLAAIFATTER